MLTRLFVFAATVLVFSAAQAEIKFEYLRNISPAEVAPEITAKIQKDMAEVVGQDIPLFVDVNTFKAKYELDEIAKSIFGAQTQMSWADLQQAIPAYVDAQLKNCTLSVSGKEVVLYSYESKKLKDTCTIEYGSYFDNIIDQKRYDKALSLVEDSRYYSVKEIFALWKKGTWSEALDHSYELPVKVVGKVSSPYELARYFGRRYVSLQSTGKAAVDDFFSGGEAPEKYKFLEMYNKLSAAQDVKFYYFSGSGNNWSTNLLIILDEKNQAYAFSMGYSE